MSDDATTAAGTPAWAGKPIWVDLASGDAAGSRAFYAGLFGWQVEVNPDPQYGGYAWRRSPANVAGIGPKMMPEAPTAWSLYIGTPDADTLADKVAAAGGRVIAPPMQRRRPGSHGGLPGSFGGVHLCVAADLHGGLRVRTAEHVSLGRAERPRVRAGGAVLRDRVRLDFKPDSHRGRPAAVHALPTRRGGDRRRHGDEPDGARPVPSYWMVYFTVSDVGDVHRLALEAGATEVLAPQGFPGGRFSIVRDPQGATFALHEIAAR